MKIQIVIAIAATLAMMVPNAFGQITELQPTPTPTDNKAHLIWNCTKPDPQTQCFTKVLKNGTIYIGNGKPSYVEPTPLPGTDYQYNKLFNEEEETETDFGVDVGETDEVPIEGGGDGGGGGDKPKDEPYCDEVSNSYDGYCWDRNVKDPTVYCDQVDPDELGPNETCHDRKDASDDTGLYTCLDGSHEEDWRDCNGEDSVPNNPDETEDWDEPRELEEDESVEVGEPTQGYEDEEGTTDECFENNDGALGDPVPCE